jgi:hypothetical protein
MKLRRSFYAFFAMLHCRIPSTGSPHKPISTVQPSGIEVDHRDGAGSSKTIAGKQKPHTRVEGITIMSTTAAFSHGSAAATASTPSKSFFERFIEARTRQGVARVQATFERMSDGQLADMGFSPDQIRHIRTKGTVPASYWA